MNTGPEHVSFDHLHPDFGVLHGTEALSYLHHLSGSSPGSRSRFPPGTALAHIDNTGQLLNKYQWWLPERHSAIAAEAEKAQLALGVTLHTLTTLQHRGYINDEHVNDPPDPPMHLPDGEEPLEVHDIHNRRLGELLDNVAASPSPSDSLRPPPSDLGQPIPTLQWASDQLAALQQGSPNRPQHPLSGLDT